MKKIIMASASLVAASLFVYGRYIEPYQLEVKEVNLNQDLDFKIAHISDLHFGKNFTHNELQRMVKEINALNVDCIIFTGDFFDDRYEDGIDEIADVLNGLNENILKYAIYGNHDYKSYAFAVYSSLMKRSGFKLLRNEASVIQHHGKQLLIVGSDDYIRGAFDQVYLESVHTDMYQILLLHEPDVVDRFNTDNYDLILSGHSHGGQVKLPLGIRGRTRLGSKYQEGLYKLSKKTVLYVSGGLGTTGTRLRIGVKPSITVVSL